MVLQLNDLIGVKDNYWIKQASSGVKMLSHDTYPEQVIEALGKRVRLDYIDYEGHHRWQRLNISKEKYPEYDGETTYDIDRWWTIIRYDKDYEYDIDTADESILTGETEAEYEIKDNVVKVSGKAILLGPQNKVIVTSTKKIERMWFYPEYVMSDNELYLPRAWNWKKFNMERKLDFVHPVPIQNKTYLGIPVLTEYYDDILKYDSIVNRMPESQDQHPTFEQIKEHLYINDPGLEEGKVPDEILKSFPLYYSRHEHHNLDIPRRAINYGVVIRCDESNIIGGDGLVVAEMIELEGQKQMRFVTGSEAFIYFDTGSSKVDLNAIFGLLLINDVLGLPNQ